MLKKLLEKFSDIDQLPIEIDEIRDAILEIGIVDEIILSAEEADPRKIHGAVYQYQASSGVYAPPVHTALIVFNSRLSVEGQRLVCCKEMIHIFENDVARTSTIEEIEGLIGKLVGSISTDEFGEYDLMASLDHLAVYQGLAFLFPTAARKVAIGSIEAGTETVDSIAAYACLPRGLVELVLDEKWPTLLSILFDTEKLSQDFPR